MITNGVKRKAAPNPTNWQYSTHRSCAKSEAKLPKKCSIKDKFPPVYRQQYGNCTSNAALGCDHYYYHTDKWIPSTTFTYYVQKDMTHDLKADDGSCIEFALDAVRKYGACNSKVWPNENPWNKKPSKEAYADGKHGHEVTNYYMVKNLTEIKKALSSGYPVALAMDWVNSTLTDEYILYEPSREELKDCYSGHAIVLVGYDDKKKLIEFRNSWGSDWGNNGYAYMTYTTLKRCAWFEDSYAVIK